MIRSLNSLLTSQSAVTRLKVLQTHCASARNGMASNPNSTSAISSPTVGIIVIGDEILKGHVQDTNSGFLSKKLFSLGVRVKRISVIPDDLDVIANEISEFSRIYTHVITAGGIGPTHDDLTFEGLARAFNDEVHHHPELVNLCQQFFGTDDIKSPKLKLAFVPKSAKLHYGVDKKTGKKSRYPLVSLRNVYTFPGVPQLLERSFVMLEDLFRNPNNTFHVRAVYINRDELSITHILNDVDAQFKDKVILGSYPDFYNSYYKVKLTLESENMSAVEAAISCLQEKLPEGCMVQYDENPVQMASERVYALVEGTDTSPFVEQLRHAVRSVEQSLEKYSLEEICVGYNGGKDCTVILHIFQAVVQRKYPDELKKIQALFIRRGQPFPEQELFLKKTKGNYHLDVVTVQGRIRDALAELKQTNPAYKAVLMGTRRSDPYSSHLTDFSPTDPGWPEYMRICPILDWSYADVWQFIRQLNITYCSLYDRGYTSLGSMENTHPNPALQTTDDKGIVSYLPAYQLTDGDRERDGRN